MVIYGDFLDYVLPHTKNLIFVVIFYLGRGRATRNSYGKMLLSVCTARVVRQRLQPYNRGGYYPNTSSRCARSQGRLDQAEQRPGVRSNRYIYQESGE